jgi:HK97 gp10 family phage protein
MSNGFVHVKGLDQLQKFLDELPAKLEANVMRAALREGANVIKEEAKAKAPVAKPTARGVKRYGAYRGALRDSIRVSARLIRGKVSAKVVAGGKTKRGADTYYAPWVEFGTAAHLIVAKDEKGGRNRATSINRQTKRRGGVLSINGRFYASVMHPGSRPKPFMRPALDAKAQEALVAVAHGIKRRLTKQGLNAQDVEIEAL